MLRPTLLLSPAKTKRVDPRLTVTRASTATYFDQLGVMKTAAANELRIDHDPVTGECKGFLIEESRTNLLTYSEQLDNAAWVKSNTTVTPNAALAPDGSYTMDLLCENTANIEHYTDQYYTVTAGQVYTWSTFVKDSPSANRDLYLRFATALSATVNFDPRTKSISAAGVDSYGFTDVGGGVYRVWLTATIVTTGNLVCRRQLLQDGSGSVTYTGDGTSGLYFGGAQLELAATPSSYIPTAGASGTRAADLVAISGANFGSFAASASVTYSQVGTVMTITDTAHGRTVGERIYIDCTSGTGTDLWATVASVTDPNIYVINHYVSVTASGNATRSSGYKSEWYNQDEGTFVVTASTPYAQSTARQLLNVNLALLGRHQMTVSATTSLLQGATVNDNNVVTQPGIGSGNLLDGTAKTFCYGYKASDFAGVGSGGTLTAYAGQNGGAIPMCTGLSIGQVGGGSVLNGHIARLAYYPKRLTNAELIALATQ